MDRIFGPDDRETPANRLTEGVDYVPMKTWRVWLVQLLNIAGTAPIPAGTRRYCAAPGLRMGGGDSTRFDIDYEDYSLVRCLARNGYAVWWLDIAGFGQSGEVEDGFLPDSDYAAEDIHPQWSEWRMRPMIIWRTSPQIIPARSS